MFYLFGDCSKVLIRKGFVEQVKTQTFCGLEHNSSADLLLKQ